MIDHTKKNVKPKLPICDGGIDPKLNLYDLTKFMNEHATNLFYAVHVADKPHFLVFHL